MFDAVTSDAIRRAPELRDIPRESLPEVLTRAHAWLATYRLSLNEGAGTETNIEQAGRMRLLRRLANSHELYATTADESTPERSAAAFVAATAHQLIGRAERMRLVPARTSELLTREAVAPDLASALLFLAAGHPSDAREVIVGIEKRGEASNSRVSANRGDVRSQLIVDLLALALGAPEAVLRAPLPARSSVSREETRETQDSHDEAGAGPIAQAGEQLWTDLRSGIRALAAALLSRTDVELPLGPDHQSIFRGVAERAIARIDALNDPVLASLLTSLSGTDAGIVSERTGSSSPTIQVSAMLESALFGFTGAHQLARLLLGASDRLIQEALVKVPTPPTVDEDKWRRYLRTLAVERPLLWANHIAAIRDGYLTPGVSAVISFPTGAGKSTLSELKIASTLFGGRRVVFLAPTRALVSQTVQALRRSFPSHKVEESLIGDGAYHEAEDLEESADISVMTPEKCLVFLGNAPERLANVGLLVFDECHLMHPQRGDGSDRRSLDAMLCLLGVLEVASGCDILLLSAMVENASELAEWIAAVTQRRCAAHDAGWKPTRQVRGCVVFDLDSLNSLQSQATAARSRATKRNAPKTLKDSIAALPYALFGLTHRWAAEVEPSRFTLLPLSSTPTKLSLNKSWQLTPNKNAVAADLAARMASLGIQVLVFVQNKDHCRKTAEEVESLLQQRNGRAVPYVPPVDEREWLQAAAEDVGDEANVIRPLRYAAVHHGLLLPAERRACEAAYRRPEGLSVLVATPTLAQGMNLPAEAVIIAGDGRFDSASGGHERLTAHELLNAAGRAGRAGHRAAGLVFVVPNDLVGVSQDLTRVVGPWESLQRDVFSKPDQCLVIGDPIELLLDRVETEASEAYRDPTLRYFVTRLPIDDRDENPRSAATRLLRRSLAAFRANKRGEAETFEAKLEGAMLLRQQVAQVASDRVQWLDRVVSTSGISPTHVKSLEQKLRRAGGEPSASINDWLDWLFDWFEEDANRVIDTISAPALIAAMSSTETGPNPSKVSQEDPARWRASVASALPAIRRRVTLWVRGGTLVDIDRDLQDGEAPSSMCWDARKFHSSSIYEFSRLAGVVAQIYRGYLDNWSPFSGAAVEPPGMPTALAVFSACVREGFDLPAKLAVYVVLNRRQESASRVRAHREYDRIQSRLTIMAGTETFGDLTRHVAAIIS